MHDYDGSWGSGFWLGMALMMLVFWGGLAVLIAWAVRAIRSSIAAATVREAPPIVGTRGDDR